MNTEIELKLDLPPSAVETVRRHPLVRQYRQGRAVVKTLRNVYFDTSDGLLRQHGISVRVRHVGRERLLCIKARNGAATGCGGGVLNRSEWEHAIEGDHPQPDILRATGLPLFTALDTPANALVPCFITRFKRSTHRLIGQEDEGEGWEVELTLDQGEVNTGTETIPLCEVELELVQGRPRHLYRLAQDLARDAGARLSLHSKAERGHLLSQKQGVEPVKAAPICLTPTMTVADSFRAIGQACLEQLLHNDLALRSTQAPEALHQLRVAIRRLRSALSLFAPLSRTPRGNALNQELRWLGGELGEARDLDVFLAEVVAPVEQAMIEKDKGFAALRQRFERQRTAAYQRALAAVESPRFTTLALDIAAWLDSGDWSAEVEDLHRARLGQPISPFAAEVLSRYEDKALRRGKKFAHLSPSARHRLRIQIKKLRYATDFFQALYSAKKTRAFGVGLAQLQDDLGLLNDIAVAHSLLATTARTPNGERGSAARDFAFAAGLIAGWHEARRPLVLEDAATAWRAFRRTDPFWKK